MPPSYVNPVPPGTTVMRQDKGQDYKGEVGQHVVAIGDAVVDAVKADPSGFGRVVYYTLKDGPAAGQQIYVGHAQPDVSPGQHLSAGDPVATLVKAGTIPGSNASQDGWTEIGLAKNGAPEYGQPEGGRRFQVILKDATLDAPAPASPAPTAPTPAAPQVQQPPTMPTVPDTATSITDNSFGGPPDPSATHPMILAPGSGAIADAATGGGGYVNRLWNLIASQPNASPDTLAYVQNVAAGG